MDWQRGGQVGQTYAIFCRIDTLASTVIDVGGDPAINVNVVSSGGLTGNQTAARVRVVANGSTTDDIYGSVTFFSVLANTVTPTVAGVALEPGRSVSFNGDPGRGLDAIAYTAGATSILEINTVTK